MSSIVDIPNDLIYELLSKLKGPELIKFCQTSKSLNNICNDLPEKFWLQKFLRDVGPPKLRKPPKWTWREFYINYTLNNLTVMTVNYRPAFWVYRNMTYEELLNELKRFKSNYDSNYERQYLLTFIYPYRKLTDRYHLLITKLQSPQFYYLKYTDNNKTEEPASIKLTDKIDFDNIVWSLS